MVIKSYQTQSELLMKNYVLDDSFVVYGSVIIGIFACKTVYELSQLISASYFKGYSSLSKSREIEWNNRTMSTFHAVFITIVSFYFTFLSDLYANSMLRDPITLRSSTFSTFALGVSVGYFLSDLGMIIWFYPSLGGLEFVSTVIHHLLSVVGVTYAMLTGEAQLYTFMVLISEATTPSINLRWYLEAAGMKRSRAYILNGVVMFSAWLVARILLFLYLFYHAFLYRDQLMQIRTTGLVLVMAVPLVLSVMNLLWFRKIFKGLKKTLGKRD